MMLAKTKTAELEAVDFRSLMDNFTDTYATLTKGIHYFQGHSVRKAPANALLSLFLWFSITFFVPSWESIMPNSHIAVSCNHL